MNERPEFWLCLPRAVSAALRLSLLMCKMGQTIKLDEIGEGASEVGSEGAGLEFAELRSEKRTRT